MRAYLRNSLFVATLVVVSGGVHAADAVSKLSWTPPDAREDGTPMTVDEIAEYRVYFSVDGEVNLEGQYVAIEPTATDKTINVELTPRAEDYVVNFAIVVVDTNGLVSQPSDPVSKTFHVDSTASPNPPNSVNFAIDCLQGCVITNVPQE